VPRSVAELMDDAEAADDEYRAAVVAAAEAKADYEEARLTALARSEASTVSGRNDDAAIAAMAHRRMNLATEAVERAAKVHVQVLLGLLVGAQSQQKFAGKQDGGGMQWGVVKAPDRAADAVFRARYGDAESTGDDW
jgi:hypothetical protein